MATTAETNVSNYKVDDATMDQFHNITNFVKNMVVKDSEYYEAAETETSKWFGEKLVKYVEGTLTREEAGEIVDFVGKFNEKVDSLAGIGKYSNDFKWIDEKNGKLTNNAIYRLKCWGLYSGYNGDSTVDSEAQTYEDSIMNFIMLYYLTQQPKLENYKNEVTAFLFKEFFNEFFDPFYYYEKTTDTEKLENKAYYILKDGIFSEFNNTNFETGVEYYEKFTFDINEILKYFNFNEDIEKLLKNNKTYLVNGEFLNYIDTDGDQKTSVYINFKDMKNYTFKNGGVVEGENINDCFLLKKDDEKTLLKTNFIIKIDNSSILFKYTDRTILINEVKKHVFNNGECFHFNLSDKNGWIIYLGGLFYTNLSFEDNKIEIRDISEDKNIINDEEGKKITVNEKDENLSFTKNNKKISIIINDNEKSYYTNHKDKSSIFNHVKLEDIESPDEQIGNDPNKKFYFLKRRY